MGEIIERYIKEKLAYFWFSKHEEISASTIRHISMEFNGAYNAYTAGIVNINKYFEKNGIKKKDMKYIPIEELYKELEELKKRNIHFYTIDDKEYPESLKNIYEPPVWLYVYGRLPKEEIPKVAVVGARRCSTYGKEMTVSISRQLSDYGVQIISGMAAGVDGYAHRGAMLGTAPTFAVLGSGVDVCYPVENIDIYTKIPLQGGIISEYPLKSKGLPFHFPMRNRIISGLADILLVIEAADRSGTLITVEHALEQGKDIFAVPGRVGDLLSEGCNKLIRSGAGIVCSIEDIIAALELKYGTLSKEKHNNTEEKHYAKEQQKYKKNNKALETEEKMVYAKLSFVPKSAEQLVSETEIEPARLMQILCMMELRGVIKQTHTNYYIRSIEEL